MLLLHPLSSPINCPGGLLSSAVEHYLHTVGVTGSIPVAPTILLRPREGGDYAGQAPLGLDCVTKKWQDALRSLGEAGPPFSELRRR